MPIADGETAMQVLRLAFTARFIVYTLSILLTVALLILVIAFPAAFNIAAVPLLVFAWLAILGTRDLLQTRHAVLRNYPISAHLRFLLEEMRPEMRQYFFEGEKDGTPFSRDKRAVVYQRAKMVLDKRPFGTQYDVYAEGYEWLRHSMRRARWRWSRSASPSAARIARKPYSCVGLQHLGHELRRAEPQRDPRAEQGREVGGFAHDTGEGGFSPYHRENGGDIIWEIGSGYFGARNPDGSFSPERFAATATRDAGQDGRIK